MNETDVIYTVWRDLSEDGRGPATHSVLDGFFLTEEEAWGWLDSNYNYYNRKPSSGWKTNPQGFCGVKKVYKVNGKNAERIAQLLRKKEELQKELDELL